jgi:hypothetical protein
MERFNLEKLKEVEGNVQAVSNHFNKLNYYTDLSQVSACVLPYIDESTAQEQPAPVYTYILYD